MDGPEPATFVQAIYDIGCNRFMAFVLRYWQRFTIAYLTLIVLVGLIAADYLLVMLAPAPFLLVALVGYFVAEWTFVARIRLRKPRCPSCKTVTWQLQCGHCGQPVPILALLYRGAFLAHCPHCDTSISNDNGTLLAWCHACGTTLPRPRTHYRRPTVVQIELSAALPAPPPGWEVKSHGVHQELHRYDAKAYTIVYRVTHDPASYDKLPADLFELTSHVWIGRGVNPMVRGNLLASIPGRRRTVLLFEDRDPPPDIHPGEWRKFDPNAPRPST